MTSSTLFSDTVDATAIAGIAARMRADDRDQLADAGDQREHVEERDAEQPQADRRGAPMIAAEQELAAEPRADLDGDVAARRGHARAVAGGKQPQHRVAQAVGVDEDVEGQDQDRQQPEQAARHADDRADHRADRFTPAAVGRARDDFLQRELLVQHALRDQEILGAVEHVGKRLPQLLSLIASGGTDHEADARRACRGSRCRAPGSRASAGIAACRSAAPSAARSAGRSG